MGRLIIDGNRVYEVDEQCMKNRQKNRKNQNGQSVGPADQKPDPDQQRNRRR